MAEDGDKKSYTVKSAVGFNVGDIVMFTDGEATEFAKVASSVENVLVFEEPFGADVVDTELLPKKTIQTCEFNMEVGYQDLLESYENVSLNIAAANFITKRLAKSDLIEAQVEGDAEGAKAPYEA